LRVRGHQSYVPPGMSRVTSLSTKTGFLLREEEDEDEDEDEDEEEEEETSQSEESEESDVEDRIPRKSLAEEELGEEGEGKVGSILEEYLCIHDINEAKECIEELWSIGYKRSAVNEEVVRRGLLLAFDAGDQESELMGKLFANMVEQGVFSKDDVARGICGVLEELPDTAIDFPKAPQLLSQLMKGYLERELMNRDLVRDGLNALRQASPATAKAFDDFPSL